MKKSFFAISLILTMALIAQPIPVCASNSDFLDDVLSWQNWFGQFFEDRNSINHCKWEYLGDDDEAIYYTLKLYNNMYSYNFGAVFTKCENSCVKTIAILCPISSELWYNAAYRSLLGIMTRIWIYSVNTDYSADELDEHTQECLTQIYSYVDTSEYDKTYDLFGTRGELFLKYNKYEDADYNDDICILINLFY